MQDVLAQNVDAKPDPRLVMQWCSELVMVYFVRRPIFFCRKEDELRYRMRCDSVDLRDQGLWSLQAGL
jgi:hypothetical protein